MPSALASDSSLIAQLCQRDAHALGIFYDRYGTLVYTLALRITGNRVAAEAVSLDVFQMCWQSAATFRGHNGADWLIGITRHYALRALHTRDEVTASTGIYELEHTFTASESVNEKAEAGTMRVALSDLSIEQRETIEMAYYRGLNPTMIAIQLNESLSTVKTYLRQGLHTLHAQVRGSTKECD